MILINFSDVINFSKFCVSIEWCSVYLLFIYVIIIMVNIDLKKWVVFLLGILMFLFGKKF